MCDSKCCVSQELKRCCKNFKLDTCKNTVCSLTDELATLRKTKCASTSKLIDENVVNFLELFLSFYLDNAEIEKPNNDVDLFTLLCNFGAYAKDISSHILKNGEADETTKQDALCFLKLYSQTGACKCLGNKLN